MTDRASLLKRKTPGPSEEITQKAQRVLAEVREYQEMFATDGWLNVIAKIREFEQASMDMLTKNATSMELVLAHRSRLQLIQWFLDLEESVELDAAAAVDLLQQEDEDA